MTVLELKEALAFLLIEHLGQYKLPNGVELPAIWVGLTDYKMNPEHPNLLECVIEPSPALEQIPNFGALNDHRNVYRVTLKDWSTQFRPNNAPQGTAAAMRLILEQYITVGNPTLIRATRDMIETHNVNIRG
jgi:hypothetical protein